MVGRFFISQCCLQVEPARPADSGWKALACVATSRALALMPPLNFSVWLLIRSSQSRAPGSFSLSSVDNLRSLAKAAEGVRRPEVVVSSLLEPKNNWQESVFCLNTQKEENHPSLAGASDGSRWGGITRRLNWRRKNQNQKSDILFLALWGELQNSSCFQLHANVNTAWDANASGNVDSRERSFYPATLTTAALRLLRQYDVSTRSWLTDDDPMIYCWNRVAPVHVMDFREVLID